jgi:hypothetical protein
LAGEQQPRILAAARSTGRSAGSCWIGDDAEVQSTLERLLPLDQLKFRWVLAIPAFANDPSHPA